MIVKLNFAVPIVFFAQKFARVVSFVSTIDTVGLEYRDFRLKLTFFSMCSFYVNILSSMQHAGCFNDLGECLVVGFYTISLLQG